MDPMCLKSSMGVLWTSSRCSWSGDEIPQRKVVDDVLDFLDIVLDAITPPPQRIVLKIEDLETSMKILDKLTDL